METTGTRATGVRPQVTAPLLAVGAIFGSSFLLVKLLVADVSPAQVTAWRLFFGGVAVAAVLARQGALRMPGQSLVVKATVLGLLDSVIPNTLLAWSQIRIDSSIAAVLISTMPLFTVVFAMALPRSERLPAGAIFGVALGIVGVTILVGADAGRAASGPPTAHLAVVLAAMSNAAAVVYARRLLASEDPMQLSAVKLLTGAAITFIAIAGAGGAALPQASGGAWLMLLLLGVLSNGIGRTMYLSVIRSAGSVQASLVAYVVPVVGVVLGWAVLGERLSGGAVAGTILIATGMATVTHGTQLTARLEALLHVRPGAATLRSG